MLEAIRLATPEEVEAIKHKADLTPGSRVVAFEKNIAVLRNTVEIDPIFFDPQAPPHKRALMLWGLEQMLRFGGASEYYFNVSVDDKEFIDTLTRLGAETTSPGPEFRYKKVL
jgi:hypothetical protein